MDRGCVRNPGSQAEILTVNGSQALPTVRLIPPLELMDHEKDKPLRVLYSFPHKIGATGVC